MACVTIKLPDIEGYEDTGEFREPELGEVFRHAEMPEWVLKKRIGESYGPRFILKKRRWRPKVGEGYYYIDASLKINDDIEDERTRDNARWTAGNYFADVRIAQKYRDKLYEQLQPIRDGQEY